MWRRRQRRPVQWLPVPGTQLDQNGQTALDVSQNPRPIEFILASAAGSPQTVAAPLVIDNPVAETVSGASMATYQKFALNQTSQYGYKLVRIVGDMFLASQGNNAQATAVPSVLVTAGIILRLTDDDGQPAAQPASQVAGSIENDRDPWIWQRSWVLSPAGARPAAGIDAALNAFPQTNIDYGTKHHIAVDQKTARVVGPEARLFLNLTVWQIPLNQTNTVGNTTDTTCTVYCLFPYRVLGRVFASKGNRRNAVR